MQSLDKFFYRIKSIVFGLFDFCKEMKIFNQCVPINGSFFADVCRKSLQVVRFRDTFLDTGDFFVVTGVVKYGYNSHIQ